MAAVIDVWKHERAAIGKAKFIADKRRDPAPLRNAFVVKVISRVESGIADKFEKTAVHLVIPGFRHDIGVARRPMADLRRHHSRTRLHFLNGVNIEIGKRRAAHLRIGGVKPIDGKHGRRAALSIDRKLLSEIRGPVGVRHSPCRQQQQLAEVTRIERKARYF